MTEKVRVIDWNKFDWEKYENETQPVLENLLHKWEIGQSSVSDKEEELKQGMQGIVDKISVTKVVTKHTRPWINSELSSMLGEVRKFRRSLCSESSRR